MKSILFFSLLCMSMLLFSGWSEAKFQSDFALNLYRKIGNQNYGKNLFFSPISVSTAFGMVHLGARGNTKAQIKSVLNLNHQVSSEEEINEQYKGFLNIVKQQGNNYTLNLVNRLFGSKEFQFLEEFRRDSQNYFQASLEDVDFKNKPEESRLHINRWVSNQTNNKINELLAPGNVDPLTTLVIINAVYFKATWKNPFNPNHTKPGVFKVSNSEEIQMDMMHLPQTYLNYYDCQMLNSQILELPYLGDKISMYIILPRDVEGLSRVEEKLSGEYLNGLQNRVKGNQVDVKLPKFVLDQSIPLKQYLQSMGMTDVFDSKVSDLSGIAQGRLYASESAHKAYVSVDEFGTEAAAATSVVLLPGSAPGAVEFNANRPFLFLITEKSANATLFLGRLVQKPVSNEVIGKFGQASLYTGNASSFCINLLMLWSVLSLVLSIIMH